MAKKVGPSYQHHDNLAISPFVFLLVLYLALWIHVSKVEGQDVNAILLYVQHNIVVCD